MQEIILGNNIEVLKKYPDNYFDSIVTDPPYGLGKEPDAVELMKDWIEKGYHEVSGSGFMGKDWDAFVPQPIFWKEVFRVLKHGGHVVAFYGTRTYDWGVMAMRFAGFEVRDCIQWLYGSGFPKSHNIGKAIDKLNGNERVEINGGRLASSLGNKKTMDGGASNPNFKHTKGNSVFEGWGSALKPANEPIVLARKPLDKGLSIAENVLKWGVGAINIDGCRVSTNDKIEFERKKENISDSGWKETNRNEYEQNSQGRFPANLILTHHPECECVGTKKVKPSNGSGKASEKGGGFNKGMFGYGSSDNIGGGFTDENGEETIEDWKCHDDCPIKILDEQSGESKSSKSAKLYINDTEGRSVKNSASGHRSPNSTYADKGGASRFFINTKSGGRYDFFMYIYDSINLNICGNTLENQKVVGTLNGVTMEIEKFTQSVEQFMCGNNSMEVCQKDMKYIISTLTEQMIELKTYNALKGVNIDFYTQDLLKTTNLLMELKIENVNVAQNTNHLMNLLLEMVEHIKVIVNLAKNQNCNNGENEIENIITNTIENTEKNSRFFYIAKASKSERNKGLEGFEEKQSKKMDGGKFESASTEATDRKMSNFHPTVKPIKLMQYLVRLITPPNGIVLDPFCGSGTTGIAAKIEGFNFVGIEMDEEYYKIAKARIENYTIQEEDSKQLKLF
jgi:site-specific DNA-methyltransferase (adenine-specific)